MASSARIEELRKKFEENPRRYFAPLANEYRKAGEVDQAISICREYLPQQPGHMSGHIVYGQALYEARQFEEAKTVFETALTLDPENLIALRHLGDISLIVGDVEGSKAWYRRVLEADPRNEEIQAQLASLEKSAPAPAASQATTGASAEAREGPPPPPVATSASSAATVVVSAVKPAAASADKTGESVPVAMAPANHEAPSQPIASNIPGDSSSRSAPVTPETLELDLPPAGVLPEASASVLELESPVGAGMAPAASSPLDGFSLSGLQSTSLAGEPAPQSLSTAPTVELNLDSVVPPAPANESAGAEAAPAAAQAAAIDGNAAVPPTIATITLSDIPVIPDPQAAPSPAKQSASLEGAILLVQAAEPSESASPATEPAAAADTNDARPLPVVPAVVDQASEVQMLDMRDMGVAEPTAPAPDSGPFVTETMAELYLQQGHLEEALRVYRALLEQRPNDSRLEAKVASLQPRSAASAGTPGTAHEASAPRTTMPSIRDVLGVLAQRRPGSGRPVPQNGGATTEAPPGGAPKADSVSDVVAAPPLIELDIPSVPSTPSPTSADRPEAPVSTGIAPAEAAPAATSAVTLQSDAVAALFGNPPITPADEGAARSLALAFAGTNGTSRGGAPFPSGEGVAGAPARRASKELSLDSVFGGSDSPAPAAPSSFSFDQFFSPRATVQQSPAGPGGAASTEAPDDVAHFTKWLEGLKQR